MGGDAFARVGEESNRGKGSLGWRQSSGAVCRGCKVWDKLMAQPSKFLRGMEDLAVKGNRWGARGAGRIPLLGRMPVDQFGLEIREINLPGVCNSCYTPEGRL